MYSSKFNHHSVNLLANSGPLQSQPPIRRLRIPYIISMGFRSGNSGTLERRVVYTRSHQQSGKFRETINIEREPEKSQTVKPRPPQRISILRIKLKHFRVYNSVTLKKYRNAPSGGITTRLSSGDKPSRSARPRSRRGSSTLEG